MKQSFEIIKTFLPFYWPAGHLKVRMGFLLSMFLVFVTMGLNLGVPILFKDLVSLLLEQTATSRTILILLISYGFLWILGRYSEKIRQIMLYRPAARALIDYSLHVFRHIHSLSLRFHLERETGKVTTAIARAQLAIAMVINNVMLCIIPDLLEVILAVGILWYLYSFTYGILLLLILGVFVVTTLISAHYATKYQLRSNALDLKMNARIVDSLLNVDTVKYFNNRQYEMNKAHSLLASSSCALIDMFRIKSIAFIVQRLVVGVGLILLTYKAGMDVLSHQLKVGDFVLINTYLLQFLYPLSTLGERLHDTKEFLSRIAPSVELLKEKAHIIEIPNAPDLVIQKARIEFNQVSFSYRADRRILKDLSFQVPPQKTLAIVGASGSGKSTISKLLLRFFEVDSGCITLDGQDLSRITRSSLRRAIGVVPQEVVLFNNTLRYNLTYGSFEATDAELDQVVKMVHLERFVQQLPNQLNTRVGERGLKLSGGERQRIGIARALLKKPAILIFDEATSSLDTKTEQAIQANILELTRNITTILIAHRLSTVIHADEIIVLSCGTIVEQGDHQTLLKQQGAYATLWQKQLRLKAQT